MLNWNSFLQNALFNLEISMMYKFESLSQPYLNNGNLDKLLPQYIWKEIRITLPQVFLLYFYVFNLI